MVANKDKQTNPTRYVIFSLPSAENQNKLVSIGHTRAIFFSYFIFQFNGKTDSLSPLFILTKQATLTHKHQSQHTTCQSTTTATMRPTLTPMTTPDSQNSTYGTVFKALIQPYRPPPFFCRVIFGGVVWQTSQKRPIGREHLLRPTLTN